MIAFMAHRRWYLNGRRSIFSHEGVPFLRAEDHRVDVAVWLQGLGLERYAPAFLDNRIEADLLPSLTVEDLKDLGVIKIRITSTRYSA
jgi:SAM domain (Sterile alpha motif)